MQGVDFRDLLGDRWRGALRTGYRDRSGEQREEGKERKRRMGCIPETGSKATMGLGRKSRAPLGQR
jgi:hypothetical protein